MVPIAPPYLMHRELTYFDVIISTNSIYECDEPVCFRLDIPSCDLILLPIDEPHLPLPRMDPPNPEDVSLAPLELEGENGTGMRPPLTSGYSKQFQKSLPPRFLRQQVCVLSVIL